MHFVGDEVIIKDVSTGEAGLRGQYSPQRKIYMIPLHKEHMDKLKEESSTYGQPQLKEILKSIETTYGAYTYEQNVIPKFIKWYHATAGFPAARTWIWAMRDNFYLTWLDLTASCVKRHLGISK